MFAVHGVENVKVTNQPWRKGYHRTLFLEDFTAGNETLEQL